MSKFQELMDQYLDEYEKLYHYMGVIRVSYQGKTVYQRCTGYEDIEHDIPITDESRFTYYSMSKAFCAFGIMLLADKGLVDLDAHPKKYLPELEGADDALTIRIGLRHMSGLKEIGELPEEFNKRKVRYDFDFRDMVKVIANTPGHFKPGTQVRYANIGFIIAALIIENVTGMKYADYMKKEVFEPLGMKSAIIDSEGLLINHRVHGYDIMGDKYVSTVKSNYEMFAAGDVVGTANDMFMFSRAIVERKLLSDNAWDQIVTTTPDNGFGLGCVTYDRGGGNFTVQHNGGHLGFRTFHSIVTTLDLDVVVLSNTGYGNSRFSLAEAAFKAWDMCGGTVGENNNEIEMDKGYIEEQAKQIKTDDFLPSMPARCVLSEEELDNIIGDYGTLTVKKYGDDNLIIKKNCGTELIVYPVSINRLQNLYIDEAYDVVNDNGDLLIWDGRKKATK